MDNLEELDLSKNSIEEIKVFEKIKFEKLKRLNLSQNYLSDSNIKIIKNLNLPVLIYLNLSINNFTDYDIFEAVEHFKILEILNISSNPFEFRGKDKNNAEYNFQSLLKLYLSNGVVSEETIIDILKKLKLKNLITINLSSNHLRTMNFIELIKSCPLENLFLDYNEIEDSQFKLNQLHLIKSLKRISIQYNLIKDHKNIQKAFEYDITLEILGNNFKLSNLLYTVDINDRGVGEAFKKCCQRFEKNILIK